MIKLILEDNFKARAYQETIFAKSIDKNSLIVLPTGLGKTIVALMLAIYYFNKTNKKILFLAPTKPLVEQQKKSFESFFKNSNEVDFKVLTGELGPSKRQELYKSDFIFSTPQVIENDLINKRINIEDFSFIIFDECHRAVGNYAYTFIAKEFSKSNSKFLGLSASPGVSKEDVNKVINNLFIEHVDFRTYEDLDVREYVKDTEIKKVEVELTKNLQNIVSLLKNTFEKKSKQLKDLDLNFNKDLNFNSKRSLLDLQIELRKHLTSSSTQQEVFKALSLAAALMKLHYAIELVESQEILVASNYLYNLLRDGGDMSKAAKDLALDIGVRDSYSILSKLKEEGILHPKLSKLKELIVGELRQKRDLKIIIFSQYRESAQIIVNELNKIKEIKSVLFVGQAKKGDLKLSQKEQKKVLEDFREGQYNVLVSTSVGEEGLDIPKVDTVFFYEPVASAIRSIQRIGRTGRFDDGRAHILITKGTRDVITSHISNAKEKKMKRVLSELKDSFSDSNKVNLNNFIKEKKEEDKKTEIEVEGVEPLIYIDSRENSDLIKELYKRPLRQETKRLDVADIVISDEIAIERKAKSDFVSSILDKRIFDQLIELTRNFRKPVLILEGEENIFSLRNLNPNVIRATLSSIAVDFRIPIIYTDSIEETANMIQTIATRNNRKRKEISLVMEKRASSEDEELERFVSSIPKINIVSAKSILLHFKSIKELVNASEEDLINCDGIGKVRANFMKAFFDRKYSALKDKN